MLALTPTSDAPPAAVPLLEVAVRLHPDDHVVIARRDLPAGLLLALDAGEGETVLVRLRQPVPAAHKLAIAPLAVGQTVRRYGQVIGFARSAIQPGDHVHTHNLGVEELDRDLTPAAPAVTVTPIPVEQRRTFQGYHRAGGRVGTRNYVAVVSTVNCSAHAAREIARRFPAERLAAFPHVDGVVALTHGSGCPLPHATLRRTLAGLVRHPNVGACLLVGLGCETVSVAEVLREAGRDAPALVIQEMGGLKRTIEAGERLVEEMLPAVNQARRRAAPISELMVALECGGSDAWSGVTANPVVGRVADELVREGGTAVLAETPEVYGAEQLLTCRAVSVEVARKLEGWVHWWGDHARGTDAGLDQNRSTGNAEGGLSTIYEKSLGAVAKGGSTPLVEVYDYAEAVQARGLVFMNSPGFDSVSVTGMVAGGCNLVLFTTGRGSVFGCTPAPSIKISTTTALYERMPDDMDLDAGRVLEGATLDAMAAELLELAIAVASGQRSKSEAQGVGEAEFCPWNREGTL